MYELGYIYERWLAFSTRIRNFLLMTQTIPVEPRKSPRQERSRATVEAIIRATAHVLAKDGYARASTNHIAAVAGVSVGSLYQYFPNKDALVLAVAEEHSEAMIALLTETALAYRQGSLAEGVRHFVRGMIACHVIDPDLHRALVEQLLHLGFEQFRGPQSQARELVAAWLELRADEIHVQNRRIAAFVLVSSVESVVHSALFEDPALLREPGFEDELVQLVLRYLGVGGA